MPHFGGDRGDAEVRYVAANGFRKTFRVMVSALNVSARGDLGFVYSFDDLTEIRRLEREVRMQDRLAAVGRLAAAIAHEIRNPLTSIAGSVSMLSDAPALSPEERHLLQIVIRESDRLNNIITDFLAYSRGKQYRFERVNLVPLLEDTLTLLEHRLDGRGRGHHAGAQFSEVRSLGAGRWRQAQTGVLELLRKCGARHEDDKGRNADRVPGRTRLRLGDEFRRHRSRHQPAADGKNLRALPVEL